MSLSFRILNTNGKKHILNIYFDTVHMYALGLNKVLRMVRQRKPTIGTGTH